MSDFTRSMWKRDWELKNPILFAGQTGFEYDSGKQKLGNGTTRWNDLPYDEDAIPFVLDRPKSDFDGDVSVTPESVAANLPARLSEQALRAASVAAVEAESTVEPTGQWDFDLAPTVNGVAIGAGGGSGSYTDEQAEDAAAGLFTSGTHTGISFVYDDTGRKVNVTVAGGAGNGSVADADIAALLADPTSDTTEEARLHFAETTSPLRFVPSPTQPANLAPEDVWIDTSGGTAATHDYFEARRSSDVSTIPAMLCSAGGTLTNRQVNAARARVLETAQYTKIRTCIIAVGTTTSLTNLRLGVWSADGTLLGSSADISSLWTTALAVVTAPLTQPLTLSAGSEVFLGIGGATVSGQTVLRAALGSPFATSVARRETWIASDVVVGTSDPVALTGTAMATFIPWVELL